MSAPVFDAALRGAPASLVDSEGRVAGLAVQRWQRPADGDDAWLLDRCAGPVVDLGCGPGRLLVALAARGIPALGVDHSPARGTGPGRAPVLRRAGGRLMAPLAHRRSDRRGLPAGRASQPRSRRRVVTNAPCGFLTDLPRRPVVSTGPHIIWSAHATFRRIP